MMVNYIYNDNDNAIRVAQEEHTVKLVVLGGAVHLTEEEARNLTVALSVALEAVRNARIKREGDQK